MTRRIIMVEDDQNLLQEAQARLMAGGYTPLLAKIEETNTVNYWIGINLTKDDLVVMDLNFKLARVSFSGIDVLRMLDTEKMRGQLPGLEQVLVATGTKGQLSSVDIRLDLTKYNVYGIEKAMSADGKAVVGSYGQSLLNAVNDIYRGKGKILNR